MGKKTFIPALVTVHVWNMSLCVFLCTAGRPWQLTALLPARSAGGSLSPLANAPLLPRHKVVFGDFQASSMRELLKLAVAVQWDGRASLLYTFFFCFLFRVTSVSFVGCLFSTLLSSDGSVTWIGCHYIIHSSGSTPCILAICMLVICGHGSKTDKNLVKLIIWQCNKCDC